METSKTALEWFQHLPEPIRSQAVENSGDRLHRKYSSLPQCLISNFEWTGWGCHWIDIYNRAKAGEFDQPQPNLNGWIPVADRLPTAKDADEGGDVLVLTKESVKKIVNWIAIKPAQIKFWQPLPKLPEVKGGDNA